MKRAIKIFVLKNKRFTECLIVTAIIFTFIGIFSKLPISLGFLNPIGNSVKDFDIYDVVFSKFRNDQSPDTNIVLVNIGNLNRSSIARQIRIIDDFNPKIIGIDLFFWEEKDKLQDSILSDIVNNCKSKVILASKLEKYDPEKDIYDSLQTSERIFKNGFPYGYANLPDEDNGGYRTIRNFRSYAGYKNSFEYSFPVKLVESVDKNYVRILNRRDNDKELINYRGNIDKFYFLDSYEVFKKSFKGSFLKDKIVLIGFMGIDAKTKTFEDIFFTPLNERYAGRAFPDMYGVVINANIISMLINSSYIDVMPFWMSFLVAVLFCFFTINVLFFIKSIYKDWFGAIFKLFIFLLTILNLSIGVYIFNRYNFKINLTLTIVAIVLGPTCLDLYEIFIKKKIFPKRKGKDENAAKITSVSNPNILSGT